MTSDFPYKVALVWGELDSPSGPHDGPGISVSRWSAVLDQPWIRFSPNAVPDELGDADAILINSFHTRDSLHAEAIRARFPNAFIIVAPDPTLDTILAHPDWTYIYRQMQAADVVAGRTIQAANVYGTFLDKPAVYLPSPIGPSSWYEPYRSAVKEDYIITLDHAFAPANTVCNVATLAEVQRQTGVRVVYVAARDWTYEYAKLAGLNAEFLGHIGAMEFADLASRARYGVDMYAANSLGRFGILCAAIGTVSLTTTGTSNVGHPQVDLYDPQLAANWLLEFMAIGNGDLYEHYRKIGYEHVETLYGFDASRQRLIDILDTHLKRGNH